MKHVPYAQTLPARSLDFCYLIAVIRYRFFSLQSRRRIRH
jgi:hypothetical protein